MPRIKINEYVYIDYEINPDGSAKIIDGHNIPNGAMVCDGDTIYLKSGVKWVKVLKLDKATGEFKWLNKPLEFITTLELTNASLDNGMHKNGESYAKNRKILNNKRTNEIGILESLNTERDLHTHFIQVLSAEQLLNFLQKQGIESIYVVRGPAKSIALISEEDYISLTKEQILKKYNCVEMNIAEAIKNPKILEQLSAPLEKNFDEFDDGTHNFKFFEECFPMRTALLNLACYNVKKVRNVKKDYDNLEKRVKDFDKSREKNIEKNNEKIRKCNDKIKELESKYETYKEDEDSRKILEELNDVKKEIIGLENRLNKLKDEKDQKKRKEELEKQLDDKYQKYLECGENSKIKIYEDLLSESLKVLKNDHGINYVEFSYSNTTLIKKMIDGVKDVDGIEFKFLISQHRKKSKGQSFITTCKELSEMLSDSRYSDKIAGFDLMGMEEKIVKPDDFNDSGEICNTLHTKLKYAITAMLESSINSEVKPTLRLHAGEIYYENGPNPNLTLELLEQIEKEIKSEYGRIYDVLDNINKKKKQNSDKKLSTIVNEELKNFSMNSDEYKIVCNIKELSELELEKELKRIKNLKDNFCLRDRLEIRIGHGLHFKDNKDYYDKLRHFGVTVELCPSSNTKLGNMKTLDEIPYDKYAEERIPVVVGTDGEGYFRDSMKQDASLISAGSAKKRKNATISNVPPTSSGKLDKCLGCFLSDWDNSSKENNLEKTYSDSGLNMNMTIDDCILSLSNNNQQFIDGYNKAKGKKKYVNSYFGDLYVVRGDKNRREIERLETEIVKTQNFISDMLSNELYFDNSELQLVKETYKRIREYFNSEKYTKAAILLVSLQGVMGYQIELEEVVYLMKENNLDFAECLKTKVINKYKFDEVERDKNHFNKKSNNYYNQDYFVNDKYVYDVSEKIVAMREAYDELMDTIKKYPDKLLNSDIKSVISKIDYYMDEINNTNNELSLNEEKVNLTALGISTLQRYFGINTNLNDFDEFVDQEKYDLTNLDDVENYLIENKRGGRKR